MNVFAQRAMNILPSSKYDNLFTNRTQTHFYIITTLINTLIIIKQPLNIKNIKLCLEAGRSSALFLGVWVH